MGHKTTYMTVGAPEDRMDKIKNLLDAESKRHGISRNRLAIMKLEAELGKGGLWKKLSKIKFWSGVTLLTFLDISDAVLNLL